MRPLPLGRIPMIIRSAYLAVSLRERAGGGEGGG
jgi:hypothetical protein